MERIIKNAPDNMPEQIKESREKFADLKITTKGDVYVLAEKISERYPNMALHCSDIGTNEDRTLTYLSINPTDEMVEEGGANALKYLTAIYCIGIIKNFCASTGEKSKDIINMIRVSRPEIDERVQKLRSSKTIVEER